MKKIKKQIQLAHAYSYVRVYSFTVADLETKRYLSPMQGFTQLRTDYVLQENWPIDASGIDVDEYDRTDSTRYVIATARGQVVAGLRLTPVSRIADSLSYRMWAHAYDLEAKQALNEYVTHEVHSEDYKLWDVTRLVTEANILATKNPRTRAESRAGLLKILAVAANLLDSKTPVWIFTTTGAMYRFMQRNAFHCEVIASGKISMDDEYESYLCVAKPIDIIRKLKESKPVLYGIARHQARKVNK